MASTRPERAAPRARFARRTRFLRHHKRLVLSVLLGFLAYLVLPTSIGEGTRLLVAFDLAAVTFLGAVWIMMAHATTADMRRRAQIEDERRYVVLALSAAAAVAILLAITSQLQEDPRQTSTATALRVALAAVMILLAWLCMNDSPRLRPLLVTILARAPTRAASTSPAAPTGLLGLPLSSPSSLGKTFRSPTCKSRATACADSALAHSVLADFFNVVVLALTINIIAGLL